MLFSLTLIVSETDFGLLAKFKPLSQIELELVETNSNSTSGKIPFFSDAQQAFNEAYDKLLHVSFILYIIAAIFTGLGLCVGVFAFVLGVIGAVVPIFTGVSTPICSSGLGKADHSIASHYLSSHIVHTSHRSWKKRRHLFERHQCRRTCLCGDWIPGLDLDCVCTFIRGFVSVVFQCEEEPRI